MGKPRVFFPETSGTAEQTCLNVSGGFLLTNRRNVWAKHKRDRLRRVTTVMEKSVDTA